VALHLINTTSRYIFFNYIINPHMYSYHVQPASLRLIARTTVLICVNPSLQ